MKNRELEINKIAEGLFQNAKENNLIQDFQANLNFLVFLLNNNPDVKTYLIAPSIDLIKKKELLNTSYKDLFNPKFLLFISHLVEHNFIQYIDEIKDVFTSLALKESNILEGTIYTPFNLDEATIQKIELSFTKYLSHKTKLKQIIDKDLILGLKVLINGTMYEYSLDSHLEEIKERLIKRIND